MQLSTRSYWNERYSPQQNVLWIHGDSRSSTGILMKDSRSDLQKEDFLDWIKQRTTKLFEILPHLRRNLNSCKKTLNRRVFGGRCLEF